MRTRRYYRRRRIVRICFWLGVIITFILVLALCGQGHCAAGVCA